MENERKLKRCVNCYLETYSTLDICFDCENNFFLFGNLQNMPRKSLCATCGRLLTFSEQLGKAKICSDCEKRKAFRKSRKLKREPIPTFSDNAQKFFCETNTEIQSTECCPHFMKMKKQNLPVGSYVAVTIDKGHLYLTSLGEQISTILGTGAAPYYLAIGQINQTQNTFIILRIRHFSIITTYEHEMDRIELTQNKLEAINKFDFLILQLAKQATTINERSEKLYGKFVKLRNLAIHQNTDINERENALTFGCNTAKKLIAEIRTAVGRKET